jgi:hypothetical protein
MEPNRSVQSIDEVITPPNSPPARTNRLVRSKSESASDRKALKRSQLQPLPEITSLSTQFTQLALDSITRSDSSSKTRSTESSSRSQSFDHGLYLTEELIIKMSIKERQALKKQCIEEKETYPSAKHALVLFEKIENKLRDSLLMKIIKNGDPEDFTRLSLASSAIIAPKKLIALVLEELKGQDCIQSERESLIQFCHIWRSARPNSIALSSVQAELDQVWAFADSDSMDVASESGNELPLAKAGKKDFEEILSEIAEKKTFSKVIGDVVADLRAHQITCYSTLSITNLDVTDDNSIPAGIQAYLQYCRSITLYTAHAITDGFSNREYILKLFICIAWRCYKEDDFELTAAIWEGLYIDVRTRFPLLWDSVRKQKKYKFRMDELTDLFNSNKRFTALSMRMEACRKANKPFIPFLKVTLEKIRDIGSQEAIIIDRHGYPRYNMEKLDALMIQIGNYLEPQKLQVKGEYTPATNLIATYLTKMQPLTPRDLATLGFPHLTKEVCLALTPFQRWDLEQRLEVKLQFQADSTLAMIQNIRKQLCERELIRVLCENKNNVWSQFFLAHECIIKTNDLFALIETNLDGVETAIPLLSFCLQFPGITAENVSKIVETTKDHTNSQVRALSKRISDRLLVCTPKKNFSVSTPVDSPVDQVTYDFENIVADVNKKGFDLAEDDLATKIASDLFSHIANLYLLLTPEHCILKKWATTHEVVKKIEEHFNSLTGYFQCILQKEQDVETSGKLVRFCSLIVTKCYEMNDFSNALALYLALRPYQEMKELQTLFSPVNNYRTLRETTAQMKKVYIPHIGILLKDIVAVEEIPSILIDEIDPVYNIDKLIQIKSLLDAFFAFKPALEAKRISFTQYSPNTNLVCKYLLSTRKEI